MAACAVVVDGDDGVFRSLGEGTDGIGHAFLHLRIGTLYGIEFYGRSVLAGIHRGDRAPAHADAVIVPAQHDDLVALFRLALERIPLFGKAHAAGQHDDLVVT